MSEGGHPGKEKLFHQKRDSRLAWREEGKDVKSGTDAAIYVGGESLEPLREL